MSGGEQSPRRSQFRQVPPTLLLGCVKRTRRRTKLGADDARTASYRLIERTAPRYWLAFVGQLTGVPLYLWFVFWVLFPWTESLFGANPFEMLERWIRPWGAYAAVQVPVTILFWFIIPVLMCVWLDRRLYRRPVYRELERCLTEPACFECGYSLAGLGAGGTTICPECGAPTPHLPDHTC